MARLSLSQNEFKVLAALYDSEEKHGYGILKIINEGSNINTNILIGSLYNTLIGLERKGYVESAWGEPAVPGDRPRRKYYKITGVGQKIYDDAQENLISIWIRTGNPIMNKIILKT